MDFEAQTRQSLFHLLDEAPLPQVLLDAIDEGRINGGKYHYQKSGRDYGCVIGLLAHAQGRSYTDNRYYTRTSLGACLIEQWVRPVLPKDTGITSPRLKKLRGWTEEWQAQHSQPPAPPEQPIDPEKAGIIERLIAESGAVSALMAAGVLVLSLLGA